MLRTVKTGAWIVGTELGSGVEAGQLEQQMSEADYLKGVYCIAPTPFTTDGSLDIQGIGRLTDFLINTGINGITILGVMGESSKVSDSERTEIIAAFLEAAGDRIPICVGTTHAATDCCVSFSKQAEDMGAKAIMVAPPKLSRSSDAALRRHYLAVAEAVAIPVVVQDHPASSDVTMSVDFLAAIADEAPHCRYLKLEDEPAPPKISRVLAANPKVQIFGGLGGVMLLEELRRGAIGTMTGFGYPEILVEIFRRYASGDLDGATESFYKYCPLIRFENQPGISLPLRKYVYYLRGALATPYARQPSSALDDDTVQDLKDLLTRLGLGRTQ